MKREKQAEQFPEVIWNEEKRTLTLEGEPVLTYHLCWPELRGGGLGGRWINWYYKQLAHAWRQRWQQEVYWNACIQLAQRRSLSRPFIPWQGTLKGEVTLWEEPLLSLRLEGEEIRGDGKPCQVCWGDVWKVKEGTPYRLKEFFRGERGWKKRLLKEITQQGQARRTAGDCFLDQGWEGKVRGLFPVHDFWINGQELEFAFPQCSIGPAAEGISVFRVSLPGREGQEPS